MEIPFLIQLEFFLWCVILMMTPFIARILETIHERFF